MIILIIAVTAIFTAVLTYCADDRGRVNDEGGGEILTTIEELDMRKWLNRAFYADKKAKALGMLVQQCRERAEGLSRASEGNDKGKSDGTENGTENALIKLAEMERKADEQKAEAVNVSAEIQDAITNLHDDDLESILIHRYLLFHTIEETAQLLNYDPRTVKRKTKAAVEKLSPNVLVCPNEK